MDRASSATAVYGCCLSGVRSQTVDKTRDRQEPWSKEGKATTKEWWGNSEELPREDEDKPAQRILGSRG
jgi:hypothetical protein